MEETLLGGTGLRISPIAYGTWQFSGQWGTVDEKEAIDAVRRARELGINFFDTAQGYGFGVAERLLARALDGDLETRRSSIVLATKGGLRIDGELTLRDSSPEWLRRGIESSLEALGIDYIDLYQIHWPDATTPMAASAEALAGYVAQGLIRHVGVSNYSVDQMRAFAEVLPVETLQSPYHLFRRGIEAEILPCVAASGIGVLAYGPLAHGLLGGRMDPTTTFPDNDWRAHSSVFSGEVFRRNLAVVQSLMTVAERHEATIAQLAVAWVLARPEVDVAIMGSMQARHVEETVRGAELVLTARDLVDIDAIMAGAVEVPGANPEGFG